MRTYDLAGIGIGPMNLGLAALAQPLGDVDAVFLDQRAGFSWHPGMLIEGTTLQVPFLADLVTMADPTSPYSFLAWLKETGRLYPFYIRESFYPLRAEYDAYCRWAAARLAEAAPGMLRWGRRVTAVEHDAEGDVFVVTAQLAGHDGVTEEKYCAKHLVLGTGTSPRLPAVLRDLAGAGPVVHTGNYLPSRDALTAAGSVTVVGSGQSAGEVYRDLLEGLATGPGGASPYRLDWVTRSSRFFPMEYTKLTLEMTSPEYTDHYVSLPQDLRDRLGREQRNLYKGMSGDLVDDIYDTLYRKSALGTPLPTTLLPDCEVTAARLDPDAAGGTGEYVLTLRHGQTGKETEHRTRAVVAATGYAHSTPEFLVPVLDRIDLDARGRLVVRRDYTVDAARRVFVAGGEEHTHGVTAPDLGFAPWRASVILAAVTGREPYPIERRIAFQTFGLCSPEPDSLRLDWDVLSGEEATR
ncbi:lysine N(6)-hydroxylase/L-ornithine N(5)-oxygenase family protein [Myceligenerans pegani]|uniref:L-lysine N6-monooxygenase MbtG n=1 Tax=Myceligenerans pegani TaxID=2776917 RepID=A0ABR9N4V4_9MICO|nr:SidA/IucD/PvdA family monooxygenase [Myceligenerans sp. TRM 65318]MBE1878139.1 SidA/IucD/PvdA family monooxygenase [Myceligenerans sp. TRM 65318]MBE3020410.1 SidA/IucD/PvdA family monooxygenase [Myceligenerans sp. TRM 65318]